MQIDRPSVRVKIAYCYKETLKNIICAYCKCIYWLKHRYNFLWNRENIFSTVIILLEIVMKYTAFY